MNHKERHALAGPILNTFFSLSPGVFVLPGNSVWPAHLAEMAYRLPPGWNYFACLCANQ